MSQPRRANHSQDPNYKKSVTSELDPESKEWRITPLIHHLCLVSPKTCGNQTRFPQRKSKAKNPSLLTTTLQRPKSDGSQVWSITLSSQNYGHQCSFLSCSLKTIQPASKKWWITPRIRHFQHFHSKGLKAMDSQVFNFNLGMRIKHWKARHFIPKIWPTKKWQITPATHDLLTVLPMMFFPWNVKLLNKRNAARFGATTFRV